MGHSNDIVESRGSFHEAGIHFVGYHEFFELVLGTLEKIKSRVGDDGDVLEESAVYHVGWKFHSRINHNRWNINGGWDGINLP